jgi:serine/threonine protein kinase
MQKRHQSWQELAEVGNRPERRNPSDLSGIVELDKQKIRDQMKRRRISKSELVIKAKVSRRTVDSVLATGRCQARVAYSIAKALDLPGHEDLMPDAADSPDARQGKRQIGEWLRFERMTGWKAMPNGLQYCVWKMKRSTTGAIGRGKCYDLEGMPNDKYDEARRRLLRHPDVCDSIGRHSAIPINKAAVPEGKQYFWIIDVWEEGSTLAETLAKEPLEPGLLSRVMLQIAEGLQVLHKQKIVRRELSPEFITLRADDQSVLLMDLELAKILDGSPPTPLDWESNPYVAPELFGGQADVRSDLFSWGQVLYHAATGDAPPKLPTRGLFDAVNVPDFVKSTAVKCVSKGPSGRPKSIQQVMKTARRWEKMARRITDD